MISILDRVYEAHAWTRSGFLLNWTRSGTATQGVVEERSAQRSKCTACSKKVAHDPAFLLQLARHQLRRENGANTLEDVRTGRHGSGRSFRAMEGFLQRPIKGTTDRMEG